MSSELITVVEAAKLFAASVHSVRLWIDQGMPSSLEKKRGKGKVGRKRLLLDPVKARAWMIEKGVGGFLKSEIKQSAAAEAPAVAAPVAPAPATPAPKSVNVSPGVVGALDRLRAMELRAFSDYVTARNAGDVLSQRAHMKLHSEAVKQMLAAEEVADVRRQTEAEVWTQVEQALVKWSEPVKALVEQMPRSLGSRCNVSDPTMAEAALKEWVYSQLFPLMNRSPKQ